MPAPKKPTNAPLHTTGRLSTRMSAADKTRLTERLAPFTADSKFLKSPPENLEVELGIGNGLALLQRAHQQPAMHFLGCELYLNGLRTLAHNWHQNPATNLHVTNADARDVLASLKPASVSRLLVLFPDPWPKSKHHKRRLLQPEFLTAAARVLKPEGEFWLVTDWPDYALQTLSALHTHKAFTPAQTGEAAARCKVKPGSQPTSVNILGPHHLATAPSWWVETKYQQKAHAAGRLPWFIQAFKA